MKKVLLMFIILGLMLSGCGSKTDKEKTENIDTATVGDEKTESDGITLPANNEKLSSQIEFKEYELFDAFVNYYFIDVTNNADENVDVYFSVSFYDDNGNLAETKLLKEEAVEPGYSVLLVDYPEIQWIGTEIEYSVTESKYPDETLMSEFNVDIAENESGFAFTVTNNGDKAIVSPSVRGLLFYEDGLVLEFIDNVIETENDQIKPGETVTFEKQTINSDYNDYRFYISGRR